MHDHRILRNFRKKSGLHAVLNQQAMPHSLAIHFTRRDSVAVKRKNSDYRSQQRSHTHAH